LLVKEKWPIVLTESPGFAIVTALMPQSFALSFDRSRAAGVSASAWWWYRGPTEEASA
jgi:hypothetical protein